MKNISPKNVILLFVSLMVAIPVCGQSHWTFGTVEEMYDNRVCVLNVTAETTAQIKKKTLVKSGDKYLKYKDNSFNLNGRVFTISQPITIKKIEYLSLISDEETFYIPVKLIEPLIPYNILSLEYLDSVFLYFDHNYAYVKYNELNTIDKRKFGMVSLAYLVLNRYIRLDWVAYLPMNSECPFWAIISFGRDTVYISYQDIINIANQGMFESKDVVEDLIKKEEARKMAELREKNRQDSIRDGKMLYAIAKKEHSVDKEDGTFYKEKIEEGDTVVLYAYDEKNNCPLGFYKYNSIRLKNRYYTTNKDWLNEYYSIGIADLDYLKRKCGDNFFGPRRDLARIDDSLRVQRCLETLQKEIEAIERTIDSIKQVYRTKQIFILNQEYVVAEYGGRFGLKWTFFNCFSKDIKYIELKVKPYNQVDDVQRDDFGRIEASARCIGPVASGERAVFSFDDLFWDDDDIIKYVKITYIKITFKDGSTKIYSGWDNIKKRMSKYMD